MKLVVALILLGFAFLIFKYDSSEGGLSVSLACDDGMTGTLSVSNLEKAPNTKKVEEHLDVKEACTSKTDIKFKGYPEGGELDVLFVYKNAEGEVAKLVAKGRDDIFVMGGVRYMVTISLISKPPFLVNDRI